MAAIRRIFSNWWVLAGLTALLLLVLFVFLAPLVFAFFDSWLVRIVIALLIVVAWAVLAAWHIIARRRASDRIEQKLGLVSVAAESETDLLGRRLREAMVALRAESGGQRDYLYSRPWYVMIGPPGAGKTTALHNSGLRFPAGGVAERGVGGTRNIEFLFTDEAVLLDTAGRYTSQDSDTARDREGWLQFLDLLRTNRPYQPVNGVIVAIGIDEIAQADLQSIDRHAAIIDSRLRELQEALKVEVPVYVVLTKADLVAGFTEFYDDLDVEGRRAVLGATLGWRGAKAAESGEITEQFDTLMEAVDARTAKRLQDELDLRRRSLIVGFPTQLAALRPRVLCFLERAFTQQGRRQPIALRGFYFTSGVQVGTPFDRVLGRVATLYDAPAVPSMGGQGRAYFINRLLKDVIIGEAGLVRRTPVIVARQRATLAAGFASIAMVSLLLLTLWTVSYLANVAWANDLLTKSAAARGDLQQAGIDLTKVDRSSASLESAAPVLDELRALPGGYAERHGDGHSIWMTFGLYQESLGARAERAYVEAAQRIVVPRLMLRMQDRMPLQQQDALALYDTLKAYLMLGGQAPSFDAKFVSDWTAADLPQLYGGTDNETLRGQIQTHVDAAIANDYGQIWGDGGVPLDPELLRVARRAVESMPLPQRAYAILKQKAGGGEDWTPQLTEGDAGVFANPGRVRGLTVPFLFTKGGYTKAYLPGLVTVKHDLEKDVWMLGDDARKSSTSLSFQALHTGIAHLYSQEYIAAWQGVLDAMTPANLFASERALYTATSTTSPLRLLLRQVADNTTFDSKAGAIAGKLAGRIASRLAPGMTNMVGGLGLPSATANDAASDISGAFREFHDYVSGSPSQLDDFLSKLHAAGSAMINERSAAPNDPSAHGRYAPDEDALAAAALIVPPMIKPLLQAAADQGRAASNGQARDTLNQQYGRLLDVCHANTGNYPFVQKSDAETTAADLQPVFGAGSPIDTFVTTQLAPHIDSDGGAIWRWKADDVSKEFSPESASAFQKLADLRDLLAKGVHATIQMEDMGANAAEFDPGGGSVRFEAGQKTPHPFQWTPFSSPQAHVTLYPASGNPIIIPAEGSWAVFRLFDKAQISPVGKQQFKAKFGDGATFVTVLVTLSGSGAYNPFSRNSPWSFRCPAQL